MEFDRFGGGKGARGSYTKQQIRRVVQSLGIRIESETGNDLLCLCPFHANKSTPSLTVSNTKGLYICFNPSCGESGDLYELVMKLTKKTPMQAARHIAKIAGDSQYDLEEELESLEVKESEFKEFDQSIINSTAANIEMDRPLHYMSNRGFKLDTLKHFEVGYSIKQDMITVPVHSPAGLLIGLVGRSIEGKRFKNSPGLPRRKTIYNIHRAKTMGGIAILVESSFDAMRLHQAGHENAIAVLGGQMSNEAYTLLDRYFSRIIIMTDNDNPTEHKLPHCKRCMPKTCSGHSPGRDLGMSIADKLKFKEIEWAVWSDTEIYPHAAKDVGDMTDEEIDKCVRNSVMHIDYLDMFGA